MLCIGYTDSCLLNTWNKCKQTTAQNNLVIFVEESWMLQEVISSWNWKRGCSTMKTLEHWKKHLLKLKYDFQRSFERFGKERAGKRRVAWVWRQEKDDGKWVVKGVWDRRKGEMMMALDGYSVAKKIRFYSCQDCSGTWVEVKMKLLRKLYLFVTRKILIVFRGNQQNPVLTDNIKRLSFEGLPEELTIQDTFGGWGWW